MHIHLKIVVVHHVIRKVIVVLKEKKVIKVKKVEVIKVRKGIMVVIVIRIKRVEVVVRRKVERKSGMRVVVMLELVM